MNEGVQTRHRAGCAARDGGRCVCAPTYRAAVYDRREGRRLTRSFPTLQQARRWRADTYRELEAGMRRGARGATVAEAGSALLAGMEDGSIRNRSGDPYKPSVPRAYEAALRLQIIPEIGGAPIVELKRASVQRIADAMLASGAAPATIRNALMPLRVICRRAIEDGELAVSPCDHLRLPAVRSRRERIASREEIQTLLAALPPDLEALYATAFFAGLRRGELRGLRWADVDLRSGRIAVRQGMDERGALIAPKSESGRRRVPIVEPLALLLRRLRDESGHPGPDRHVFFARRPFTPSAVRRRAERAWTKAGVSPITLHECRHTFVSVLIAAGINAKAISTFCGHSSIQVTYDLYGKLMPGSEDEMVERVQAYLGSYTTADTTSPANPHE